MASNVKAMLAAKLEKNTKAHREAHQATADIGRQHVKLPVDQIDPNPYQPRTTFPEAELQALAESIKANGLLQPIVVRQHADRYQILAGERRWRAHKALGKATIEAIVDDADDGKMAVAALEENIARADLSDYEISKAFQQVQALFPTKVAMAKALEMNRQDLYRFFAFGTLPEFVIEALEAQPRLLSRVAAEQIGKVITAHNGSSSVLEALRDALELVKAKELDQTKIGDYIARTMRGETVRIPSQAEPLKRGNLKIGSIARDERSLVIKLKTAALSGDQEQRLREFLDKLVAEAV